MLSKLHAIAGNRMPSVVICGPPRSDSRYLGVRPSAYSCYEAHFSAFVEDSFKTNKVITLRIASQRSRHDAFVQELSCQSNKLSSSRIWKVTQRADVDIATTLGSCASVTREWWDPLRVLGVYLSIEKALLCLSSALVSTSLQPIYLVPVPLSVCVCECEEVPRQAAWSRARRAFANFCPSSNFSGRERHLSHHIRHGDSFYEYQ